MRAAYMRSELVAAGGDVAQALEETAGRAEQADPIAREVLGAVMPALADPELADLVAELRRAAAERSLLALARLLRRRAEPEAEPSPDPAERPVLLTSRGRTLTLGERKALARRAERTTLDRLLRDPHPMVIRMLLKNPRVTEDDIVRLAARRPAYPDVLAEIARDPSWSQRARVRMALIQNPGAPADLVVPMVRMLIRPELERVVAAVNVPPIVRAAARELLERRPPVPARKPPSGQLQ